MGRATGILGDERNKLFIKNEDWRKVLRRNTPQERISVR
jgi:hypothetical protein